MSDNGIKPEALAQAKKELEDLRARKQQIELALKNPAGMGPEYTVEQLEKENVTLANEIARLTKDFDLK